MCLLPAHELWTCCEQSLATACQTFGHCAFTPYSVSAPRDAICCKRRSNSPSTLYAFSTGDCAATTVIAPVSQEHQRLVAAAKECLNVAVRAVKPGLPIAHIGKVITEFAHSEGFSVVSEFCGHFIGRRLHLPPLVPHKYPNDAEHVFKVGQTFTIGKMLLEENESVKLRFDVASDSVYNCSTLQPGILK
ncbi:hypothetical protein Esti_004121 [Eimeria stiedai]